MLTRVLSNRVPLYQDFIEQTIHKSIPDITESTVLSIYRDLLLDLAQVWISHQDAIPDALIITRINHNQAIGGKVITILCTYAPDGTELKSFVDGFEALKKFGQAHGCKGLDFYTTNEHIIGYARQFPIAFEAQYFLLNFD